MKTQVQKDIETALADWDTLLIDGRCVPCIFEREWVEVQETEGWFPTARVATHHIAGDCRLLPADMVSGDRIDNVHRVEGTKQGPHIVEEIRTDEDPGETLLVLRETT